ncbi:MAG TPA: class I SAM-dependent methyltransferase [Terriglobia bacterium]|nr:class I SAM-dependent methyltransferase [Terriglobia bacterium]
MEAVIASHAGHNLKRFSNLVDDEKEYFRWQSQKVDLLVSILRELNPHGTLADIGCFTGAATVAYRSTGFDQAVGFDLSPDALGVAAARGIEPRPWHIGEEPCPAAASEFDFVVAADIIEHIVDTDEFLRELWRILKPGGSLILTTPNLGFWLSRLRLLLGKPPWSYPGASSTVREDLMVDLSHIRITTRREWEALFRARSFKVEKRRGWSILGAKGNRVSVCARRAIDRWATRFPDLAYGLLFVLRKVDSTG